MGSLEYHALELFFLYWIIIIKKNLFVLFLWIIVSRLVIFSTNLFIPNKAIIISITLGELIVLRKILRPDHYGKGTKYIIRFFVK